MKKQKKNHQNAKSIGEKLKTRGLMFARFQTLICKLQCIWPKLLVVSGL